MEPEPRVVGGDGAGGADVACAGASVGSALKHMKQQSYKSGPTFDIVVVVAVVDCRF